MSILNVQDVSKSYGNHTVVLKANLSIEPGDNLAIIGESGSGKTTLAKMIMGLIRPDEGRIEVGPQDLQMVFQDPNQSLDPLWKVRHILNEAFYRNRHALSKQAREEKMLNVLSAVGLPADALNRFPHEFSGGERQRIAIARALLASPKILVLDEAVSALDTLVQQQIMQLLKKLKQEFNLTYIFISHNLRLVRNFSDKIVVMYKGEIVERGQVRQVLTAPAHPYTQQLLNASFYRQASV